MSLPPTATVIVARTAHSGLDRRARAWLEDIVSLASEAQGFVRSDIQPPGPQHPDEWVVVYEFSDQTTLSSWLTSADRLRLVDREPDLFVGSPREQILATRNLDESVTAVASFRLRTIDPDAPRGLLDASSIDEVFAHEYAHLDSVVSKFPGFIRCELFEAEPGVQDETIVVFSFENRETLDGWLNSDERQKVLNRLQPLFESDRTMNIVGGFAGWFGNPGDQPVRTWKQGALILLALYPTALVIGVIRDLLLPDIPGPLATFIGNAGGVIVLTWWLMPILTARYANWLRR